MQITFNQGSVLPAVVNGESLRKISLALGILRTGRRFWWAWVWPTFGLRRVNIDCVL